MADEVTIPIAWVKEFLISGGGAVAVLVMLGLANKKLTIFIDRDMWDKEKITTADQFRSFDKKISDLETHTSSQVSEIKEHLADARLANVKEFVSKTDMQTQMSELKSFMESRLTQIDVNINRLFEEYHRK